MVNEITKKGETKMHATVVGINKTEFRGNDGPVKNTKYNLVVESQAITEGHDIDSISWNEIEDGKPPAIKLGDKVEVHYIKQGQKARLVFSAMPEK